MRVAIVAMLALVCGAAPLHAGQDPSAAQAADYRFTAATGLLIFHVHRDRADDFEAVMARIGNGLQTLTTAPRPDQAEGWRLFRARDTAEAAIYIVLADPAVPGADYDPVKMITEVAPAEAPDLYQQLRDAVIRVERLDLDPLR